MGTCWGWQIIFEKNLAKHPPMKAESPHFCYSPQLGFWGPAPGLCGASPTPDSSAGLALSVNKSWQTLPPWAPAASAHCHPAHRALRLTAGHGSHHEPTFTGEETVAQAGATHRLPGQRAPAGGRVQAGCVDSKSCRPSHDRATRAVGIH